MRRVAVAALAFALAACGGGDGGELAAGNSQLSSAQVDAALGPADQSSIEDAVQAGNGSDDLDPANAAGASGNEGEE